MPERQRTRKLWSIERAVAVTATITTALSLLQFGFRDRKGPSARTRGSSTSLSETCLPRRARINHEENMENHARTRSMLEKAEGIHQEPLIVLEEMALSHIEAESSTLKHLERGNHSDCDSDNDSENKMTSVAIWASRS